MHILIIVVVMIWMLIIIIQEIFVNLQTSLKTEWILVKYLGERNLFICETDFLDWGLCVVCSDLFSRIVELLSIA